MQLKGMAIELTLPYAHEENVGWQTREQSNGNAWRQIINQPLMNNLNVFLAIFEDTCRELNT